MYSQFINYLKEKPALYAPSSAPFWDDEHISKHMLKAHLDPELDAASRRHGFIEQSAEWIAQYCNVRPGMRLLDLGCGPGLYAEKFSRLGFSVTGLDFSRRSIKYAMEHAEVEKLPVEYEYRNYLDMDYQDVFDAAVLIYCDFGVLPPENRKVLLQKIYKALKNNGIFIVDGDSMKYGTKLKEMKSVEYLDQGFWSGEPHVCIQRNYQYPETNNYVEQYVIVTDDACQCYNNWNQLFTAESLERELREAGFETVAFFDDVCGRPFTGESDTICAVSAKRL